MPDAESQELLALRNFAREVRSIAQYLPWKRSPDLDYIKSAVANLDRRLFLDQAVGRPKGEKEGEAS